VLPGDPACRLTAETGAGPKAGQLLHSALQSATSDSNDANAVMKRVIGLALVAAAVGVWAGIRAWPSGSTVQTGLAIVIGGNLLMCLWLWYRARPGSGDAMVLPGVALLSASMLIGIVPRLFWPGAERLHIAASIASLIVTTGLLVTQIRQIRRRRET
jgi:FtsH-binding integral membrane protein